MQEVALCLDPILSRAMAYSQLQKVVCLLAAEQFEHGARYTAAYVLRRVTFANQHYPPNRSSPLA